ncbi:MAG: hypothetical protein ACRDV3_07685 [Acidothermaceae bacterium]
MTRPRYTLTSGPEVIDDVAALVAYGPEVVAAANAIVDDLAHGRVTGKQLGDRHVSGDLTGLARVKFDVEDRWPQRFRLVYRQVDADTRDIVAIGVRDEHAIYLAAVRRVIG